MKHDFWDTLVETRGRKDRHKAVASCRSVGLGMSQVSSPFMSLIFTFCALDS